MEEWNEPIDQYIREHRKNLYFHELFEKFRVEKEAGTLGTICMTAGINRDVLYKIVRWADGTYNRDILWGLSIVMELNIEETEMLFNSCGMTIKDCRNISPVKSDKGRKMSKEDATYATYAAYERERAIEFGIINGWDIDTINEALENRGFQTLGNV